ncbi:MAG: HNH endonuclease [Planctomycetota bacterium]|nr:HNH endonuclease [Planctomycetota bacterium]
MNTPHTGLDTKVLVLNKHYSAVRVVDARRAFTLLFRESAEVVSVEASAYVSYDIRSWAEAAEFQHRFELDDHDWVTTTSFVIAVPKVIRLLGYDRLPREVVKLNRRNIYTRDASKCQYCGSHFSSRELTLDHVVPRVQGGGNTWENLVCACVRCNARKGGRTPKQAQMHLIRPPIKPRRNPAIVVRLGQSRYQSWKTFLDEAYWTIDLSDAPSPTTTSPD